MKWLDYPFYRILFFLIAGIIFQYHLVVDENLILITVFISLLTIFFVIVVCKYFKTPKFIYATAVYIFFIGLGALLFSNKSKLSDDHFIGKQIQGRDHALKFQLFHRLTPNKFNDRFYAQMISLDGQPVTGKTLVLFKRSDSLLYQVGDLLTVYDDVNLPAFARNPGDFDYRNYLKSIDVYGQIYVDQPKILSYKSGTQNIGFLLGLRNSILKKLALSKLNKHPRGMIEALVLGQRQNVDPIVTKSFRDAGVIHILALSGLHVGIILLILRVLTNRILRLKYGRRIQSAILVSLLWLFALLTGMSPSIMRAVTMFSFVAVGMNLKRKGSVYHGLTLSAFVLLIYDPRLLFQVGFQLSYMAVFSIVLIQPVIASLWPWRNKIKDFFWNIFTVTVAAQIGVAGISLFYFHQFPGLFILGNMLLLPVLPLIIGAALLLICLLLIGIPTGWLTTFLNVVLEFIIDAVAKISALEAFVIKDVHLTFWETALIYMALFSGVLFLLPYFKRSKRERFYLRKPNWMLHLSLLSMVFLLCFKIYKKMDADKESFMILHQATGSAVSLSNQDQATLFTDLHVMDSLRAVNSLKRLKAIKTHRDKDLSLADLINLISYKNRKLLVIGENGLYDSSIKNATVLLSHSPKINLERLILETQPKSIIADGSNYRNVVEAWEITCNKMGVELLNTYEVGAVKID